MPLLLLEKIGTPGRIRTCDPLVRSQTFYDFTTFHDTSKHNSKNNLGVFEIDLLFKIFHTISR